MRAHRRRVEGIFRIWVKGELRTIAVLWPRGQSARPAAGRWMTLGGGEEFQEKDEIDRILNMSEGTEKRCTLLAESLGTNECWVNGK